MVQGGITPKVQGQEGDPIPANLPAMPIKGCKSKTSNCYRDDKTAECKLKSTLLEHKAECQRGQFE